MYRLLVDTGVNTRQRYPDSLEFCCHRQVRQRAENWSLWDFVRFDGAI
ncbi:MAG: hypothetical protein ACHBN1_22555 [Heteroscytonema crispum UTEX LB 1556]